MSIRTHREWEFAFCGLLHLRSCVSDNSYSTALQTVLVAILMLCIMGVICSLTTKTLHRIILLFAPINSTCSRWSGRESQETDSVDSLRDHLHLHCAAVSYSGQAASQLGLHSCH